MPRMSSVSPEGDILKVTCELHTKISAVNVYISSHQSCTSIILLLHPNYLNISQYTDGRLLHKTNLDFEKELFIPTSFCSICGTVTELKNDSEAEAVRVVYSKPNSENANHAADSATIIFRLQVHWAVDPLAGDPGVDVNWPASTGEPIKIHCSYCDALLTRNSVVFRSVISWGNTNIDDVAENMFCHRTVTDIPENRHRRVLRVTPSTCFLRCLDLSQISWDSETKCYACNNCNCLISRVSEPANNQPSPIIGCYRDKIYFCSTVLNNRPVFRVLFMLREMIEQSLQSSVVCKLYLECEMMSPIKCILLWVIDTQMKRSIVRQSLGDSGNEILEFVNTTKVFYQITNPESAISTHWRRTFQVDYYHISDIMFDKIDRLLSENTFQLYDATTTPGFSVSYLPIRI